MLFFRTLWTSGHSLALASNFHDYPTAGMNYSFWSHRNGNLPVWQIWSIYNKVYTPVGISSGNHACWSHIAASPTKRLFLVTGKWVCHAVIRIKISDPALCPLYAFSDQLKTIFVISDFLLEIVKFRDSNFYFPYENNWV